VKVTLREVTVDGWTVADLMKERLRLNQELRVVERRIDMAMNAQMADPKGPPIALTT
jgi:hypothetical protein